MCKDMHESIASVLISRRHTDNAGHLVRRKCVAFKINWVLMRECGMDVGGHLRKTAQGPCNATCS